MINHTYSNGFGIITLRTNIPVWKRWIRKGSTPKTGMLPFLRLSKNLVRLKKPRRVSAARGGNKIQPVIPGDMRVGNDTSHAGKR